MTTDSFARAPQWHKAGDEPALDDVFAEPIVRLIMICNSVDAGALRATLARVRQGWDNGARPGNPEP